MSLTTIVELLIKPDCFDAYVARLNGAIHITRAAKGCLGIEVYVDRDVKNRIVAIEHWESQGEYDDYIEWRRRSGSFEKLAEVLERPMTLQFLDKSK